MNLSFGYEFKCYIFHLFLLPSIYSDPPGPCPELQGQIQHDQTGLTRHQDLVQQQPASEPPLSLGVSPQLNGVLQRAGSARSSGKSASADDLLERLQKRPSSPQHSRSRSSPTGDRLNQVPQHATVSSVDCCSLNFTEHTTTWEGAIKHHLLRSRLHFISLCF